MTAIDAAVQSRLLGAEEVTIVYRRGRDSMGASRFEQDLATGHGVRIVAGAVPVKVGATARSARWISPTREGPSGWRDRRDLHAQGRPSPRCDRAAARARPRGLELAGGKIRVTGPGRTSLPGSGPAATARPAATTLR